MGLRSFVTDILPTTLHTRGRHAPTLVGEPEVETFAQLVDKLGYLSREDLKQVRAAYKFADEAHLGQFRASGQPYITHPIAVAALVADWKLDAQAVMAALMHDSMEDCGVTKVELIERFGSPTAELVDGLTKLDKLQFSTREEGQAESFRKMLMAMSRDVRVILVKLADRLHNMRTMGAMAAHKRARIARETLDIYAPIAHRLGLNQLYRELQELAFSYVHPWRHAVLHKAITRARGYRRDIVERVRSDVDKAFGEARVKVEVSGREKTVFSIYRKMREKHAGFAQVTDIYGFRVVVQSWQECYLALGVLHQLYHPMPGRFKDYIAIPKPNGYQSLHTTLVNPLGTSVEFQIRTEEMHAIAETGIAAHWLYKVGTKSSANPAEVAQTLGAMWLKSLMDIQRETHDASEFLEHVKIDLVPDSVYVFTPQSKIMALPRGATPLDFAYAIHSRVGDHCVAARINGEPAALRAELKSGDVVEIITNPGSRPSPGWLNIVRTGRARSKIRHYLKNLEHEESQALGEQMLTQALRAEGMALPPESAPEGTSVWPTLLRWSGNRNPSELMLDIGLGRKVAAIVAKRLAQLMQEQGQRPDAVTLTLARYAAGGEEAGATPPSLVVVDGSEGTGVSLATCCRPIPGDEIQGYLGRGEGLVVHTGDCGVARRLSARDKELWIPVAWSEEPVRQFDTDVQVLLRNDKGTLARLAAAVASAEADIHHIDMGDEARGETAELRMRLSVRDRQHLADVLRTLKRSPSVLRASRVKPERPPG
ncbi:RelA/SpoT family protein [Ideonella livida]|uniref:Bifunctional (P)ppGpp synthetase/guanosine-3',5'-bis(Diphosphate) 3'-pyrophosphohydrolase n=1 Tax=Ideonella livida TaxID=2707176 RepID=A0A7C9PGT7_9BURK|nr:bifunctional (p)ppGpp synthetase/guanosine-3',5'-bis(diphosphate) 3'-pyrophosphohydrolase [Ideonella livida]NDY91533.1 bifunctional (p)ppGpp synthetase/guanosine-3',5'-bis(diphosphate) 3'-pyrophosphohydrolase [Ideonella livida]